MPYRCDSGVVFIYNWVGFGSEFLFCENKTRGMPFEQIIEQYFIAPVWGRSGYNIVNTAVYAVIALIVLYFIYRKFEKSKFEIQKSFWVGALGWVLFGSSLRVITDSVDSGAFLAHAGQIGNILTEIVYPKILESGIFEYGILTVSPGIYVVTATLFLLSIYFEKKIGMKYWAGGVGVILGVLNLLLLSPMFAHMYYGLMVFLIAGVMAVFAVHFFRLNKLELVCPVFGHALDGAATWVAIDIFGPAQGVQYFEQHVLSRIIGEISPFGFGLFFLFKVGFAIVAVKLIDSEKDQRLRMLALLVIAIIGLAPGLRDIFRMVIGT